jgi:hypothetical protein
MNLKTRQALQILMGIDPTLADHINEMHRALNAVTHPAWKLSIWNDHNFTAEDESRWRRETQIACMTAEKFIEPRRPYDTDDTASILNRIDDAAEAMRLDSREKAE